MSSEVLVPDEVREILDDSLTERGLRQWWDARNRCLDDRRPRDYWTDSEHRKLVISAANAFAEGFYV